MSDSSNSSTLGAAPKQEVQTLDRFAIRNRVAVVGATGYTGQEFVRLAGQHPGLDLVTLITRDLDSTHAQNLISQWNSDEWPPPTLSRVEDLVALLEADEIDTVISCLPHGVFRELFDKTPALRRDGLAVIDCSSDFRDGAADFDYGFPEGFRDRLRGSQRIASPGCYPTAALLALLPALDMVQPHISITAVSGVSGAGRSASESTSFVAVEGGAKLYKAGTVHPHVVEIERSLGNLAGGNSEDAHPADRQFSVGFAPQIVPMSRGILLTALAQLNAPLDPGAMHRRYQSHYEGEPFVRVLQPDSFPETKAVRGSNRADVWVTTIHGGNTLMVSVAIDNLVKGAAGQAVQCLNLMMGWPEVTGLSASDSPW